MRFSLDPNPVMVRELRSTLRAAAFPRVLYLSTGLVAAVELLAALLFIQDGSSRPDVGRWLFQTYFTVAYAVVALVSSVYGAGAISRDAESGALEAISLTNLSPWRFVGGKLAALCVVTGTLLVASLPAAAVSLLYGGVSPWEIVIGTVALGLVALLGISLGLAISARTSTPRWSLVLTVAFCVPAAAVSLLLVTGLGELAHRSWSTRFDGPFWFASALAAGIDGRRVAMLIVLPLMAIGSALWYLVGGAIGPLQPSSEDRFRAFRRWVPGTMGLMAVGVAIARPTLSVVDAYVLEIVALMTALAVGLVGVLTLAGGPRTGSLRGPGTFATMILLVAWVTAGLCLIVAAPHVVPAEGTFRLSNHVLRIQTAFVDRMVDLAVHVFAFVGLAAALAFALRSVLASVRAVRIATGATIATLGLVLLLAEAAGPGSFQPSIAARLSPLYSAGRMLDGMAAHCLEPTMILVAAGVIVTVVGLLAGWLKGTR